MLERWTAGRVSLSHLAEMRALLDKPDECRCKRYGKDNPHWPCPVHAEPSDQLHGEPVAQSEFEPDAICLESDGCPTEGAVLKRFWRENQPDPVLCEFYEAEDFPSLVRELVGHVAQLQEAAKRNVKPWEDTFPPTLLPAYIARINVEQPAPVADHTQCEECKGWGYHENHHEGGGTECGECGGSGNATVAVALDTSALLGLLVSEISVDDRGFYHLSGIHPNNFKRALEASGAKLTSEVKSHKSPVAVVMTDEQILEAMRQSLTDADGGYVFDTAKDDVIAAGRALLEVAKLNGVKP